MPSDCEVGKSPELMKDGPEVATKLIGPTIPVPPTIIAKETQCKCQVLKGTNFEMTKLAYVLNMTSGNKRIPRAMHAVSSDYGHLSVCTIPFPLEQSEDLVSLPTV